MKRKITVFFVMLLFMIPLFSVQTISVKAQAVGKAVNYEIVTKELSDNKIRVNFNVENVEDVYGAQIYLKYNTEVLEYNETIGGNIIVNNNNSKVLFSGLDKDKNICYSITKLGEQIRNQNSGTLFSVIFTKKSSANFDIKLLDKSLLSDKNGNYKDMISGSPIQLDEIEIKKVSTENYFNLGQDGKITVSIKNNSELGKNVTLILALYDTEKNIFVSYNTAYQKLASNQEVELTGMMNIPAEGKYKVKALVWDTIYNMNPLSKVIEIPVK